MSYDLRGGSYDGASEYYDEAGCAINGVTSYEQQADTDTVCRVQMRPRW